VSEFHEAHFVGKTKLTNYIPEDDDDIATMKSVRLAMGSGDQGRAFFCTDVFSTGNVQVTWAPDTSPSEAVVISFTADTSTVQLAFLIEGGLRHSPTVNLIENEEETPVTVTQSSMDERLYDGVITIELTEQSTELQFIASTGTTIILQATLETEGPSMTVNSAEVMAEADGHTEAKEGDGILITGIVANTTTSIFVISGYAAKTSPVVLIMGLDGSGGSAEVKTFTLELVASALQGVHAVHVQAVNDLGTKGQTAISPSVVLDQTKPVITQSATTYPDTQGALKGNEQAIVNATVNDFDDVLYEFDNGTLTDATTYSPTKFVVRTDGVDISTSNFKITAHKERNNSTTEQQSNIRIQTQAPSFGILFPAGDRYTTTPALAGSILTIQPSTDIRTLDSVTATEGIVEDVTLLSPTLGRFKLSLDDNNAKGNHTLNVTGTTLSGITGNTDNEFSIEGSSERTLTYAAASQITAIGTTVFNVDKLAVKYAGTDELLAYRPDKSDYVDSFTVVDSEGNLDVNGTHLWLSDAAFAGSNTSGTLQVTFAETP
jgi:hypothetical protein